MLKPSFFQEYSLTSSTGFRGASIDSLLALRGGDAPLPPPVPSRFDPLVQKFLPGYEQHPNVIAALILAFALRPAAKMYYEHLSSMIQSKLSSITGKTLDTTTAPPQNNNEPFEGSTFNKVVETIVEAARLFILIAAFDIFNTILGCLGLRLPKSETLTDAFGLAVFFLWGFRRLGRFKFYVLKKTMVHTDLINDPRRLFFINRLMDYALVFLGIFAFYEILNVEMGYSAKSLVAAFSFGTAAIALSTKEIITNFLNGVILSASDRIFVGDIISIQGEVKKVNNLGWLETKLRGSDNILYTVPNTELVSTKLSNLSRVQTCQVRQTLKFPYSAVDRLSKLSHDIKAEIRTACPSIITDGSKPFQCYWVNFGKGHLDVMVNAHFRIPPVGDAYYENRQQCLQAIDRAIRRNEIEDYSGDGSYVAW